MYMAFINDVRQIGLHTGEPLVPEPSCFKFEIAIEKLKRYTLSSSDQVPAQLFQARGNILYSEIHKLINSIWCKEELLQQCKKSVILHIYKKGDKIDSSIITEKYGCYNYIQHFTQCFFPEF